MGSHVLILSFSKIQENPVARDNSLCICASFQRKKHTGMQHKPPSTMHKRWKGMKDCSIPTQKGNLRNLYPVGPIPHGFLRRKCRWLLQP